MKRFAWFAAVALAFIFAASPPAMAACSNPSGNAGDMLYNGDYHVPQYCNGTNWNAMGKAGAGGSGCGPSSSGLLAWWKFDESSGTSAADSSGNGNTGTLKNAPTWVAGKIGNALSLNGTNQYVDVANPSNFNFSAANAFTFTAWIKRSSASNPDDEIIDKLDQSTQIGYSFWMPNNGQTQACNSGGPTCTSNCLLFAITGTIGKFCAAAINTPAAAGAWHHVAVTYDGNNTGNSGINFYVDGALQTTTYTGGAAAAGTVTNANDLFIGIDLIADSGDYFNGKIDDARVYNRALSPTEIAAVISPAGSEGDVIYNGDFHVLQFCDGTNWNAMGPVPGAGGAGCTSPAGNEGDIIYNSASSVMQYCDGSLWQK